MPSGTRQFNIKFPTSDGAAKRKLRPGKLNLLGLRCNCQPGSGL